MRLKALVFGSVAAAGFAAALWAQVPQMIGYQGRVLVSGTNYTGNGQFKFALLDAGVTNIGVRATASAVVISGSISLINVINGGSNYISPPVVTITDPTGSGALAAAVVNAGVVVGFFIQNGGHNYSGSPTITIAPPPTRVYNLYWSNDGTSVNGGEPTAAVPLPVSGGLFNVLLGDTTLSNMLPISPAIFINPDVRLRVWFDDGVHGTAQLAPDQRIAAVGYAMIADNVVAGAITSAQLAPGAVSSANLGPGAVQNANLAANAVGTVQLTDGAVTAAKIGAGAVGTAQLADGSVSTAKLGDGAVTGAKLGSQAVQTANLANSAVAANQLADGNVTTAKLAGLAVTTAKLADTAVTAPKLATKAVQTANIADGAVGPLQLSADAVGGVQQVIRGTLTFYGGIFRTNATFSPSIDTNKSYVLLSDPLSVGGGAGTASDKAGLVSLSATSLTVAVSYSGSTMPTQIVSFQIIQAK
jgi:hypothetical protein